ncbi:MAG: oleate hydratase, partial [Paenibacillaceae bacterium]|nr:oleate hydratase [Paenibacillaceae bacterium]
MEKSNMMKLLALGAAATAAGVAAKTLYERTGKSKKAKRMDSKNNSVIPKGKAYFVGGGLGSLAGAAYLIRDCKMPGNQITIFEGMPIFGGSNDGIGTPEKGFVCRGGRMLNEETYENFWELFRSIPSLSKPGRSVTEEILDFDHAHPTSAKARLIDKDGTILDVKSMGFNQKERMALLKLMNTPEEKLDDMTIEEWFADSPHFFTTNFWYMWQTTFAFQKWSSLFEFRRYMRRMILEFSRINTLEGVTRTPLNQYDSVIRPLETYLRKEGVIFAENCTVTDIDFAEGDEITAKVLHLTDHGVTRTLELEDDDICIMTNACMTDSATLGDLHTPA